MTRAFAAALILATWCLLAPPAVAQSADPGWFSRQFNAAGGYCCTGADGHLYYGPYTINADGSVTIPLIGQPFTIPAGQVLGFNPSDPNPTGTAVWWYAGDTPTETWCFALGPLT